MMIECIDDRYNGHNGQNLRYAFLSIGKTYKVEQEQKTVYVIRTPMGLTHYPKSKFKMAEVHYVPTQEGDKEDDI